MIWGFPALHPNFVMHFCLQRSMVSNPSPLALYFLYLVYIVLGLNLFSIPEGLKVRKKHLLKINKN